jgi:hypothetical protein
MVTLPRMGPVFACGAFLVAACGDSLPPSGPDHPMNLQLVAGDVGGEGNADGVGALARFDNPCGGALDRAATSTSPTPAMG